MSVFQESTPTPTTEEGTPPASFVEQLVAAKGDNWADPNVIAKGKLEADKTIESLKAEVEALKLETVKGAKLDDLLNKLEDKTAITPPKGPDDSLTPKTVSENDIQNLVEETLSKRELANTANRNIAEVDKGLSDRYGTEAGAKVREMATTTGLSLLRLQELAAESPSAFFQLMGEAPKAKGPDLTSSTIRTESVNMKPTGNKNFSFYQKLRKDNPTLYRSQGIQQEMMNQRMALGDQFYN